MILKHYWDRCETTQGCRTEITKCQECTFNSIKDLKICFDKLLTEKINQNLKRHNDFYSNNRHKYE